MKLLSQPESGSYSLDFPEEALRVQLDGGKGRYRRDILNGTTRIAVVFILDPTQYEYFMAFYRRQSIHASEQFEMDLIVQVTNLVTCNVNFIPGSVKLASQSGHAYTVSAELEVEVPFNATEDSDDDTIISAYNTAQGYTP